MTWLSVKIAARLFVQNTMNTMPIVVALDHMKMKSNLSLLTESNLLPGSNQRQRCDGETKQIAAKTSWPQVPIVGKLEVKRMKELPKHLLTNGVRHEKVQSLQNRIHPH